MNLSMFYNIPEELRLLPNWVLWRLVPQEGKKPTKIPYCINGYKADTTDLSTWRTFDQCFSVFQNGNYDGLGFVFTNTEYSGIDLDDCSFLPKDKTTGEVLLNPNYQNDLNRQIKVSTEFDSYSEVSPSGKGLHIIVKGKVPDGKNNRAKFIEVYPSGRFFTMTGNVHNNKPIKEYQELLLSLWTEIGGVLNSSPISIIDSVESIPDTEILDLARKHNAAAFEPLEAGAWQGLYPSQSEADQAYLNIISYYTNSRIQVERIFRASKLMRSKINTNKGYLSRSITTAFDQKLPPLNFDGLEEAFKKHKTVKKVEPEPFIIKLPPGLMGEIASFIYASSPRPVPEVSLAAAIGLMAGICGRSYNISGTGLNQYVLLLAMTGAGKEAMAEGIDKLMSEVKLQVPTSSSFIGPAEISSGAALFKYLGNTSQSFVSLLGEFGLRLRALSAPNANGAEVSLRRMILDLYNKSGHNRTLAASAYSKKEDSTHSVPSPAFTILGESTPERFYEVLNEDMISEGLLPRFLLIEYKGKRVANNENRANVKPTRDLLESFAGLVAHCDGINHSNPRRVVDVQADADSAKFLYDFDKLADAKINSTNRDVIRQLWNRAHIKVLKLAALVAVGENMFDPIIRLPTVTWAADLVQADIANLTEKFEAGEIGGNTAELTQAKEAIRILKEFIEKDFDHMKKYGAVDIQHKDKVVNNDFLNRRLATLAPFRNDKMGKTIALKRTMQNLIDCGKVIELKGKDKEKYKTSGILYLICPDIMND